MLTHSGFLAPIVGLEPTTRTLAVPDSVCGGHAALPIVDRGANLCSLYPPPAALANVAVNSRDAAVNTKYIQIYDRYEKTRLPKREALFFGAYCRARTYDPAVNSRMLYRLS